MVVTFDVRTEVAVAAARDAVYRYVTDLGRAAEWSPECRGGRWIEGVPGEVGSVFEGENHRTADVVPWAPVVRGSWTTESEVVEAEPPRVFRWAMRNRGHEAQDSVWSFEMTGMSGGTRLTHSFRMGRCTEGLGEILDALPREDRTRFLDEWARKLEADMSRSLDRIKSAVEAAAPVRANG